MVKKKPRRRRGPVQPLEIASTSRRLLDWVKLYQKWLILGGVGLFIFLGGWGLLSYQRGSREAQAQAALDQLRPRLSDTAQAGEVIQGLDRIIQDYAGTQAGRQALLFKGHLLYQTKKYAEAARAYEDLLAGLQGRDEGGWAIFVSENLSYCYEVQGEYGRAAQVLQPLADQVTGPYQGEILERLALLFDKAGNPKEARRYLERQLLKEMGNPVQAAYVKERLADLEAREKKGGK